MSNAFKEITPIEVHNYRQPLYTITEFPINTKYDVPLNYQKYRNNVTGAPLNGVYARPNRLSIQMLLITHGILRARYKFPHITTMYHHPMLSWENQLNAAGYLQHEIEQVLAGKKPIGFSTVEKSKAETLIEEIEKADLPYIVKSFEGDNWRRTHVEIGVCQRGLIRDHFNMDDIVYHYNIMLYADTGSADALESSFFNVLVREEALQMKDYELRYWLDLYTEGKWDYGNPRSFPEMFKTGLLLGYPLEATYAFMLGDIKIPE